MTAAQTGHSTRAVTAATVRGQSEKLKRQLPSGQAYLSQSRQRNVFKYDQSYLNCMHHGPSLPKYIALMWITRRLVSVLEITIDRFTKSTGGLHPDVQKGLITLVYKCRVLDGPTSNLASLLARCSRRGEPVEYVNAAH